MRHDFYLFAKQAWARMSSCISQGEPEFGSFSWARAQARSTNQQQNTDISANSLLSFIFRLLALELWWWLPSSHTRICTLLWLEKFIPNKTCKSLSRILNKPLYQLQIYAWRWTLWSIPRNPGWPFPRLKFWSFDGNFHNVDFLVCQICDAMLNILFQLLHDQ